MQNYQSSEEILSAQKKSWDSTVPEHFWSATLIYTHFYKNLHIYYTEFTDLYFIRDKTKQRDGGHYTWNTGLHMISS